MGWCLQAPGRNGCHPCAPGSPQQIRLAVMMVETNTWLWLRNMHQNDTLVYGNKHYSMRDPSSLILSHTHMSNPVRTFCRLSSPLVTLHGKQTSCSVIKNGLACKLANELIAEQYRQLLIASLTTHCTCASPKGRQKGFSKQADSTWIVLCQIDRCKINNCGLDRVWVELNT